ncbi:phosphoribosylglycinamide formyltransferase [Teratosphaeria nubilosa]|uniref:Phosphoribosylglycinamide formyltransferase n=1 Tax=Teratosphaeria nubilosa TaxID=161662 RepID=A0A6G1L0S3_9PEZI|nr:phosphoribosylglycinamide formyltransferase [Teratosphaeria nubilosa]
MADGSEPKRITVLISGSGTNLQAIIDASNTERLPNVKIVRVISDRAKAYGLVRAENAGIPTSTHGILPYKKKFPDDSNDPQHQEARRAYDADLAKMVLEDHPDIIVCAGFMRILTTAFLNPIGRENVPIINLHPGKPGDLVGAHCIERAWCEFEEGKRKETGIMIHYVIEEVDMGEPIVDETISIGGCKTSGELEERIHSHEHGLIVKGTKVAIDALKAKSKA